MLAACLSVTPACPPRPPAAAAEQRHLQLLYRRCQTPDDLDKALKLTRLNYLARGELQQHKPFSHKTSQILIHVRPGGGQGRQERVLVGAGRGAAGEGACQGRPCRAAGQPAAGCRHAGLQRAPQGSLGWAGSPWRPGLVSPAARPLQACNKPVPTARPALPPLPGPLPPQQALNVGAPEVAQKALRYASEFGLSHDSYKEFHPLMIYYSKQVGGQVGALQAAHPRLRGGRACCVRRSRGCARCFKPAALPSAPTPLGAHHHHHHPCVPAGRAAANVRGF